MKPSFCQRAIYDFVASDTRNLVVEATAGSGKSTVLIEIAQRIPQEQPVCFLAFNQHAAEQLKNKLPDGRKAKTIHSASLSSLHWHFRRTGIEDARLDPGKYRQLARAALAEHPPQTPHSKLERKLELDYFKSLLDYARYELTNERLLLPILVERYNLRPPEDRSRRELIDSLIFKVLEWGRREALERGVFDFADMLWVPVTSKLPSASRYDVTCVDEAQDLSRLQLEAVLRLRKRGGRLIFVGDARQAIYGFAGADADSLARIGWRTQAVRLPLSITYRCPKSHVRMARAIAPEMEPAPGAKEGSIRFIGKAELPQQVQAHDLVLCRLNAPLIAATYACLGAGKAAMMLGKDVAPALFAHAEAAFSSSLVFWQKDMAAYERKALELLEKRYAPEPAPAGAVEQLSDELACVTQLVEQVVSGGGERLADLKAHLDALFERREGAAVFSSVHRAKGKEASRVFVLRPDSMPSRFAFSAEARKGEDCVRFVALTRATDELVFVEEGAPPPGCWWRDVNPQPLVVPVTPVVRVKRKCRRGRLRFGPIR